MFYIDTTNLDCIEEYELYRYEDLLEDVLIGGC